jgi:hypothetical protein
MAQWISNQAANGSLVFLCSNPVPPGTLPPFSIYFTKFSTQEEYLTHGVYPDGDYQNRADNTVDDTGTNIEIESEQNTCGLP